MLSALEWLSVFVGMCLLDLVYVRWTQSITSARPTVSANFAAVLIGITAFVTVSYVQNRWLVIPLMAGAWVGTWIGVTWPPRASR